MPEEKGKISPAETAIVCGAIAFGTLITLALLATRAAPPEVYTCPYCGATFNTEEELLAHIEIEHPEAPPPEEIPPRATIAIISLEILDSAPGGATVQGTLTYSVSPGRVEWAKLYQWDSSGIHDLGPVPYSEGAHMVDISVWQPPDAYMYHLVTWTIEYGVYYEWSAFVFIEKRIYLA